MPCFRQVKTWHKQVVTSWVITRTGRWYDMEENWSFHLFIAALTFLSCLIPIGHLCLQRWRRHLMRTYYILKQVLRTLKPWRSQFHLQFQFQNVHSRGCSESIISQKGVVKVQTEGQASTRRFLKRNWQGCCIMVQGQGGKRNNIWLLNQAKERVIAIKLIQPCRWLMLIWSSMRELPIICESSKRWLECTRSWRRACKVHL